MPIIGIIDSAKSGNLNPTTGYWSIASQTLASPAASVTFSAIPALYTDLVLWVQTKDTGAVNYTDAFMRFNGDSSVTYNYSSLAGNGLNASNQAYLTSVGTNGSSYISFPRIIAGNSSVGANYWSTAEFIFPDYTSTTKSKFVEYQGGATYNSTGGATWLAYGNGLWSTASSAISSIVFSAGNTSFATGSTFHLFGVKAFS